MLFLLRCNEAEEHFLAAAYLRDQGIDLCLLRPLAARIIPLKDFPSQLQFLWVVARLIPAHTEIVLGFRSPIGLGITNQNLLEALHGVLEVIMIECNLTLAQDDLGDKILRR